MYIIQVMEFAKAPFKRNQLFDMGHEPRIDVRQRTNLVNTKAGQNGVSNPPHSIWIGRASFSLISCRVGSRDFSLRSILSHPNPKQPDSRPRIAFWSDSLNVRPIAMTSPTDFICVVRTGTASWNFSNAHRGILVTT